MKVNSQATSRQEKTTQLKKSLTQGISSTGSTNVVYILWVICQQMQDSNTLKYAHTILHQKIYKIYHHKCVGENERQVKKLKK